MGERSPKWIICRTGGMVLACSGKRALPLKPGNRNGCSSCNHRLCALAKETSKAAILRQRPATKIFIWRRLSPPFPFKQSVPKLYLPNDNKQYEQTYTRQRTTSNAK